MSYGYRWETEIRPRILARAGGRMEPCGRGGCRQRYLGGARCENCHGADWWDLFKPPRRRSRLDVAHLDGDRRNESDANLRVLCRKCHRKLDLPAVTQKLHEHALDRKDGRRPLLNLEGSL